MSGIAGHLWQSTWFALAAGLFAMFMRRDNARIRYWIWLCASLKFLVPFASLAWLGNHMVLKLDAASTVMPLVQQVAAPLAGSAVSIGRMDATTQEVLIAIWMLGSIATASRWLRDWRRSRELVRSGTPTDIDAPVRVLCSDRLEQPAAVGILDPVIVLPRCLSQALTPEQLDAVLLHEIAHVRRRDNLLALVHAVVQMLCWFHPLVWWIGTRLVQEREQACDEAVVGAGGDPRDYAEALVRVCRHSLASRQICAASAAGGDLSARVRAILQHGPVSRVCIVRRAVFVVSVAACAALPVASGMTVVSAADIRIAAGTVSMAVSRSDAPAFIVMNDDYVYARNVSVRELISEVYAVDANRVTGHGRSLDHPRFDIELRGRPEGRYDRQQLVADLLKRKFNLELIVLPQPLTATTHSDDAISAGD